MKVQNFFVRYFENFSHIYRHCFLFEELKLLPIDENGSFRPHCLIFSQQQKMIKNANFNEGKMVDFQSYFSKY